MILATHSLAGAIIGKSIQNPWIIALFSFIFHYVLDTVRHGEYVESFDNKVAIRNTWWKVILDLSLGLGILSIIFLYIRPDFITIRNIFIGVLFSILPDFLTFLYWKFNWYPLKKLYEFHSWCHRLPRYSPLRKWELHNEVYEIIIALTAIFILLFI